MILINSYNMEELSSAIIKFFTVILLPFFWIYTFIKTIIASLNSSQKSTNSNNSREDVIRVGGRKKK